MLRFFGIVFALMVMFAPGQARADCTLPAGTPGSIFYNQTEKIFQYCSDTVWKRMNAVPGTGTGGCTNPAMAEGQMTFNADHRVLQGCAGNVHRPFGPVGGGTKWKSISTGNGYACAVKTDGTLWCWGSNENGRLGDGTLTDRFNPVQENSFSTNWLRVSTSNNASNSAHTCAIKANGTLWCWGYNVSGQLGDGTTIYKSNPVQESSLSTNWQSASAGGSHTCAIRTDGTLWCWGYNGSGQLGDGTTISKPNPVQESSLSTDWQSASAGGFHTCAIRTNGTLWCWGHNADGQLGDGTTINKPNPVQETSLSTNWQSASAGDSHTCAIKANGTLWCWGHNSRGQLGDGTTIYKPNPVQEVTTSTDWLSVSARNQYTCAIKTNGTLWCWGYNYAGQLGDGTMIDKPNPVQEATTSTDWLSVSAGGSYTCAIKTDGVRWCWGLGAFGDGSGQGSQRALPIQESTLSADWLSISADDGHSCAIKLNGTLWCWGADNYGQLGNGGGSVTQYLPTQESTLSTNWLGVNTGGGMFNAHSCAIRTNGTLWCWGGDSSGQLGNGGGSVNQQSPVQESSLSTNWSSVSAGESHTCAVKTNGTLWCWGSDSSGELGNGGGSVNQQSPMQESSLSTNWSSVSAGSMHTCAVKTDNSLWCWGTDFSGQLGNGGGSVNQQSPVQEGSLSTNWSSVSAGDGYTCAVKANGTLWCWGNDGYGQLGNGGGSVNQQSPVQESSLSTNWLRVSTGTGHTCGIKSDTSLWCWGRGNYGQLGDGNFSHLDNPVFSTIDMVQVSAGMVHTCAIDKFSRLWCWGAVDKITLPYPEVAKPIENCPATSGKIDKKGVVIYNAGFDVLQYCDGVGWVGISKKE